MSTCTAPTLASQLALEHIENHRLSESLVVPVSLANQHPIIFEDSGNVVVTTAFIHVLVPVNITAIDKALHDIEQTILKEAWALDINTTIAYPSADPLNVFNNFSSATLLDKFAMIKMDFTRTKRLLPFPEGFSSEALEQEQLALHRVKRIPALAMALIPKAVGTFWGFFAKHAISALKSSVARTDLGVLLHRARLNLFPDHFVHVLDSIINRHITWAYDPKIRDKVNAFIPLNTALDILANTVQKFTNAIQQLSNHRLAVDLLSESQIRTIQNMVLKYAKSKQVFPLISNRADFYQIDTSYIRDGNEVTAILHIPCARESQLLSLLKYVPSPIPLPASARMTAPLKAILSDSDFVQDQAAVNETFQEALFFVAEADFIAVSSKGYKLLTQADLAKCVHRNHIYICSRPTYTWVDFSKSCIGSLYNKDEAGAMKHCAVDRRPFQELVYQTGTRSYIVFSPEQFTARVSCVSESRTANIPVTSRISLPPGCSLALKDHILEADEQYEVQATPEISAWDWSPMDTPASRLEDPTHIEERLRHLMGNSSFKSRIDKHFNSDFLPDGSPLESVMVFLIIVASGGCAVAMAFVSLNVRTFLMEKWKAWLSSLSNDQTIRPPADFEMAILDPPGTPSPRNSPRLANKSDTLRRSSKRHKHSSALCIEPQATSHSVHKLTSASQTELVGSRASQASAPLYRPLAQP